jgi:uncharacterized protein (DUF58 family)
MALYPQIDDLLELRHRARSVGFASHHRVNSAFSGLYASVFRGSGLDFEEVREYREGDDIRNMEWHVTARTDTPHLKVFREERERSVMLCVDDGPHMSFGTRGTFKSIQAARAAALIGWAAHTHHDRVGGLIFGDSETGLSYFRPNRGRRALWRLLQALSLAKNRGQCEGDPLRDALQKLDRGVSTGSLIFVIAALDREVESLEYNLGRLQQRHAIALLPVDDPADKDIPSMGKVMFTGPDGSTLEVDTDEEQARRAYRDSWEERRGKLRNMAHRLGITLIPLVTNEDVHRSMVRGLLRHAGRRVLR